VILLLGAIGMLFVAYTSFFIQREVHSIGMFALAVFGCSLNGYAFWKIRKSHSHLNSRAIMLHLLEDVLGWFAVLVGAVVIYCTGWNWIDGVLTGMIALFIGWNAGKNLISTGKIFLQSIPDTVNTSALQIELQSIV